MRLKPARVRKQIAEDRLRKGGTGSQAAGEELAGEAELEPPEPHWKDKLLGVLRSLQRLRSSDWRSGSTRGGILSKSKSRVEAATVASTA
jgi:hypothetical protein